MCVGKLVTYRCFSTVRFPVDLLTTSDSYSTIVIFRPISAYPQSCQVRHRCDMCGSRFCRVPTLGRLCMSVSACPTHPYARPCIMLSSRRCLMFPLPDLRKSGTDDANSISLFRMLPWNLDLFCNFRARCDAHASAG